MRALLASMLLLSGTGCSLGAAAVASTQLLPGNVDLVHTLNPGEIKTFWVKPSAGTVTWSLTGAGRFAVNEAGSPFLEYRAPRAGGSVSVLTASADLDPSQRVVYTLRVLPQSEPTPPPNLNLLPNLTHVPAERNQGSCSNCYAWAATAAIELELLQAYGIRDRLSIQYFNDIYQPRHGEPADPCSAHSFSAVLEQYTSTGRMVSWANPHAAFKDTSRRPGGTSLGHEPIGMLPNYRVKRISSQQIETKLWSDEDIIQEMKQLLSQGKALIARRGSHYRVVVGYNAEHADPGQDYWILLDSFGASPARPEGTVPMLMRPVQYDIKVKNGNGELENHHQFDYISELVLDLPMPEALPEARVQPLGATLRVGQPLQLVASVRGTPPVTYQWLKDGVALTGLGLEGRKSVLALPAVGLADAGNYSVAVSNGIGTAASDSAKVRVLTGGVPSLTVSPEAASLGAGGFRSFRATVLGLAGARVHWTLSGAGLLLDPEANPVCYRAPTAPAFATLQAQALADPNLTASISLNVKPVDLNGDGSIDVLDLAVLARSYMAMQGDPNFEEAADLNGDGVVDAEDAMAFLAQLDEQP